MLSLVPNNLESTSTQKYFYDFIFLTTQELSIDSRSESILFSIWPWYLLLPNTYFFPVVPLSRFSLNIFYSRNEWGLATSSYNSESALPLQINKRWKIMAKDLGSLIMNEFLVFVNPFQNKPWFLRVCSTSHLKTLWEKEKLLVTSNFSISHSVRELFAIFSKFEIVVCKLFQFGRV